MKKDNNGLNRWLNSNEDGWKNVLVKTIMENQF